MANPAQALKEISKEMQDKFDEAGMGKVEEFTDSIDDIIAKAKSGPKEVMDAAKSKVDDFKAKIDELIKNPSSLAPDGGGMAACADWYGKSVGGKLGGLCTDATELANNITKVASDMQGPLNQLKDTLEKAMTQLEGSLKALAKLPKLVTKELQGKDSPDDIAKIDTAPMKKALNCGDVDGPLDSIKGLKDVLGGAVDAAKAGIAKLADFIGAAPDKVKDAFGAPPPLCFLSSMLLSQAPQAMKDLLAMVDQLKAIDLNPIITMLEKTTGTIGNLDVAQVKTPMNKFLESAGGVVDKLEKTVQSAKLMSNPAGALGSVGSVI